MIFPRAYGRCRKLVARDGSQKSNFITLLHGFKCIFGKKLNISSSNIT
jgi:hypothetical protein